MSQRWPGINVGWGDGAMDQGSQRNLGGGIGIDATLNKKSIAQPSSSASQQASTLPRIR
jgi:hypothetical protein